MKTMAPSHYPAACNGIALIAVLWIVAALSIIATGITHTLRQEVRMMTQARQQVEAQALGDGAIQIALQAIVASNQPVRQVVQTEITYRGVAMRVQIMPLNGLIDINAAGLPLLERLFAIAGGLPSDAAQAMAQAVVQARERRDERGRSQRFEAEEDLLRVPGIGYDLYARLSRLVTAQAQGSGRVNPQAAPEGVLRVLAGGDAVRATALAAARDKNPADLDSTVLNGEFLDNASSPRYRLQARVALADNGQVVVEHSVDLRPDFRLGLPWRIFHAEHWMQAPPAKGV